MLPGQVAEVLCFGVGCSPQERLDVEDLLQRLERGTVVVVERVAERLPAFTLVNGDGMNMPIGPSLKIPVVPGLVR
jgi:hypothetical protein